MVASRSACCCAQGLFEGGQCPLPSAFPLSSSSRLTLLSPPSRVTTPPLLLLLLYSHKARGAHTTPLLLPQVLKSGHLVPQFHGTECPLFAQHLPSHSRDAHPVRWRVTVDFLAGFEHSPPMLPSPLTSPPRVHCSRPPVCPSPSPLLPPWPGVEGFLRDLHFHPTSICPSRRLWQAAYCRRSR